jgi:hypothetical protein
MILDNLFDKVQGKLEKMLILGFKDSDEAKDGGIAKAKANGAYLEAFINPESYKVNYRVSYDCKPQAPGTDGQQNKFSHVAPEELSFDFLFDDTGIIDGELRDILKRPNKGVYEEVKEFREILVKYYGDKHQTRVLVLVWGNFLFQGNVTDLSIHYKLFNSSGEPIRAVASVKFRGTISEDKQAAKIKKSSPDLTHILHVKAGDTLPLMCKKVYGDPKYYLQVAEANDLGNFRRLAPGMEIVFPPIDKTTSKS